jgi:hypothetical protein
MIEKSRYPLWVTLPYLAFVLVLVPVYLRQYGPQNFLWFSDIALFVTLIAVWTGNRLLASMMAVGVLPLEVVWTLDFFTGGHIGLAGYMYDSRLPLFLRALSLFHLFFPAIVVWMLIRQGYDSRAYVLQTLVALVVLPASYLIGTKEENINWVWGPGGVPQGWMSPVAYLVLYMVFLPVVIFLPTHLALKKIFAEPRGYRQSGGLNPSTLSS